MRQNLHNHTLHSDGAFTPRQIIDAAIAGGMQSLGISDHFFTKKVFRGESIEHYMKYRWSGYISDIEKQKDHIRGFEMKYWLGVEIDTCFDRLTTDFSGLPWNDLARLDYLLLEYAGEECIGGIPLQNIGTIRKFWDKAVILAHPNLDFLTESLPLGRIFDILHRFGIAMEITAGRRNPWFWNRYDPAALSETLLVIGTDTHRNITDVTDIESAVNFLCGKKLSGNIRDPDGLSVNAEVRNGRE